MFQLLRFFVFLHVLKCMAGSSMCMLREINMHAEADGSSEVRGFFGVCGLVCSDVG